MPMPGDNPWADLVNGGFNPLARAGAVSQLSGGGGGGLDLSSAFSIGQSAALGKGGDDAASPSGGGGGLGDISPILTNMIKQQFVHKGGDEPLSSQDKGLALAQAGFSMAAGQSPHALSNVGAGAAAGIDALQKLRQERALMRMRELTFAQTAQQHMDQLQQTQALRGIQQQRADEASQAEKDRVAHNQAMEAAENWAPGGVTPDGKVMIVNKKTGATKITDMAPKGTAAPLPDLPPDELRKALPKSDIATADAIIEGRIMPPSAGNRSAAAQRMLGIVTTLDPTFDATNTNTRFNTAKFFNANGLGGQAVNSANTLVGHLGNFDKHIDDLGNTDWATSGNTIKNFVDSHSGKINPTTTAALGKFNADVDVATRELQRLLTRTGGTGEEAQALRDHLSAAKTPTELHAVVQEYVELMDSRLNALADQKTRGMGKDTDVWKDFYSDKARTALQRISPDYAKQYMQPETDTTPAYSQDDLEHTAKLKGITVEEVKKRLGLQ